MTSYINGLNLLQSTTLSRDIVINPGVVPDVDLAIALHAFGQRATGNPRADRDALIDLAQQPVVLGQPHPAQLSLAIFLNCPASLRNALMAGNATVMQNIRASFNLVYEGINLMGARMNHYRPRISSHQVLDAALDSSPLTPQERSLARRAMYLLDEAWGPQRQLDLHGLARGVPGGLSRAERDRLDLDEVHMSLCWSHLLDWVRQQPEPAPAPLLVDNVRLLDSFVRDMGGDESQQAATRAVASAWMRAIELGHDPQIGGVLNTQINPVRAMFALAMGGSEQDFVGAAILTLQGAGWSPTDPDPTPTLGQMYRWWLASTVLTEEGGA